MVRRKQSGFTIVELLIVIVVIGILAGISIVAYSGIQRNAQVSSVRADLENLQKAMLMYRVDVGTLPPGADFYSNTTMPPPSTWVNIVNALKTGGYITTNGLERDPWGQYYWYDNNDCTIGQGGSSPLRSVGPDGALSTSDDITVNIVTTC